MSLLDDVRDWVGSTPDDNEIMVVLDRFAGLTQRTEWAALSILRRRRADLYNDRSFAITGDTSWGTVAKENLFALDDMIGRLENILGESAGNSDAFVSSVPVVGRPDFRGR